jgi:hypothetical protein
MILFFINQLISSIIWRIKMADDNEDGGARAAGGDVPSGPVMVKCFCVANLILMRIICCGVMAAGSFVSILGDFSRETETSKL